MLQGREHYPSVLVAHCAVERVRFDQNCSIPKRPCNQPAADFTDRPLVALHTDATHYSALTRVSDLVAVWTLDLR